MKANERGRFSEIGLIGEYFEVSVAKSSNFKGPGAEVYSYDNYLFGCFFHQIINHSEDSRFFGSFYYQKISFIKELVIIIL